MGKNLFSPLGLGTAGYEHLEQSHVLDLVHCALDHGLTHIDTAEMYGWGEVEKRLGNALKGYRNKAFIGTKVWPTHASFENVKKSCEVSLKNLGTDHIDLYTLHWPSDHPIDQTMEALIELKDKGKVGSIGVSNFTTNLLSDLKTKGYLPHIVSNQIMYNLQERLAEENVFETCRDNGLKIVGYSPLSGGQKFDDLSLISNIAQKHDKTPYQVALNFLSNQGEIFLIPKATKEYQIKEIAAALSFDLSTEDRFLLDQNYPIRGPRDGISLPVNANHYFRGSYENEIKQFIQMPPVI